MDVTIVVADSHPNYSICGLPFYVSGETPDWRNLAHRSEMTSALPVSVCSWTTAAVAIDADRHEVTVVDPEGSPSHLGYDRLVISTGARPARPPIDGMDLPRVHVLHSLDQAFMLHERLEGARRAVVVGGGYIGVELADALTHRGLDVALIEMTGTTAPSCVETRHRLLDAATYLPLGTTAHK